MKEKDLYRPKGRSPYARRYVPKDFDAGNWDAIQAQSDELLARDLSTVAALESWIADLGELIDVISEEGARRSIAHSRFTEDRKLEAAHRFFVETIGPKLTERFKALEDHYLAAPARAKLPRRKYQVFDRNMASSAALFRKENIPLQTQVANLTIEYGKITGSMMVKFRGKTRTLQEMAVFLEDLDRDTREEAWRLTADRRLADRARIDRLFDQMLKRRHRIARNAGKRGYEQYAFHAKQRFDYTPKDCIAFGKAVADQVVPLNRKLERVRAEKLGLRTLRPWDYSVDVDGLPPLRPCEKAADLVPLAVKLFRRVDPALAGYIADMDRKGLFDLESRKGKRPGGFMCDLAEVRLPFIFMNAAGLHRDLETILHEAGHAFHVYEARDLEIAAYRQEAPMEFCEVASMSMELVAGEYLHLVYGEKEANRAKRKSLEGVLSVLAWIATIDGFQRWIYNNPEHSRAEREAKWVALMKRFGARTDWTGLTPHLKSLWHRQLHIFHYPFYYIEYGIAQLGALQVWANYRRDPKQAIAQYREALALGGSRPLPDLFKAAGIRFDFSERTIRPLMKQVERELETLESAG